MNMIQKRTGNRRRAKSVKFRPTHDFIRQAVDYYLDHGGRITRLERQEDAPYFFTNSEIAQETDEFLNGA